MRVREIKKEDIKAGAVLIPRKFDPKKADHEKVEIESVIEKDYLGINSAAFKGGMWDSVGEIMKRYYLVESDGDTVDELRVGESSSAYSSSLPTGAPIFDGDTNQQIGGTHYTKNDPIQFAKDNYPPEHLEGFYRINVDKYMARYDKKNGIEDIKKAKHYIEMLLELKLREKRDAE